MAESFEWQEVYARLAKTGQALETGGEVRPDEVTRILRGRAQALAKPLEEAPSPTEVLELLVFSLAGERYGIETVHILEVIPLRELTLVPNAPPFVLGVVNHRGRIVPVLDFRRLVELVGRGVAEGSRAVVVEAGGMVFAIITDVVQGIVGVGAHELALLPAAVAGGRQVFLRGVTAAMVAVLDLPALARDPRIVVNDE